MTHHNKWTSALVLFFILLLCGLMVFAALGEAPPDESEPDTDTTTPSASCPAGSTPSAADTSAPSTSEPTTPPQFDLAADLPLYNKEGRELCRLSAEEYLCGALLSCMSFTLPPSALEAQAVALRTDLWRHLATGGTLSTETYGYTDRETLLSTWGADFTATIWERAADAVAATRGMVLTKGGSLYLFDDPAGAGVLLADTTIGTLAKTENTAALLAFFYPSATFTKNS